MSGGLTPCRQLRPSSRREHVKASKSYMEWKKKRKKKNKKKWPIMYVGNNFSQLLARWKLCAMNRYCPRIRHVKEIFDIVQNGGLAAILEP